MEKHLKSSVLAEQINNLPVSENFKEMAKANGFETLEEMVSFSIASLFKRQGFSMHIYHELYKFLEKKGCIELLKTE